MMTRLMPDFDLQNLTLEDRRHGVPVCRIFPKETDDIFLTDSDESEEESEADDAEKSGSEDESEEGSETDDAEKTETEDEAEQGIEADDAKNTGSKHEAEQRIEANDAKNTGIEESAEHRIEADDAENTQGEDEVENVDRKEDEREIQIEHNAKEHTVCRTSMQPKSGAVENRDNRHTAGLLEQDDGVTANWTESVLLELPKDISVGDMRSAFMTMDDISERCTESVVGNGNKDLVLTDRVIEDGPATKDGTVPYDGIMDVVVGEAGTVPYDGIMDVVVSEAGTVPYDGIMDVVVGEAGTVPHGGIMDVVVSEAGTVPHGGILDVVVGEAGSVPYNGNIQLVVSDDGTGISIVNNEDTGIVLEQWNQTGEIYTVQDRDIIIEEQNLIAQESGTKTINSSEISAKVKQRNGESVTKGKMNKRKSAIDSDVQVKVKKKKVSEESHSGGKRKKGKNKNKDSTKVQGSVEKEGNQCTGASLEKGSSTTHQVESNENYSPLGKDFFNFLSASEEPGPSGTETISSSETLDHGKQMKLAAAVNRVLAGCEIRKMSWEYGIKMSILAAEAEKRRITNRNNSSSSHGRREKDKGRTPQEETTKKTGSEKKHLSTGQAGTATIRSSAPPNNRKRKRLMEVAINKVLAGCAIKKMSCAYRIKASVLAAAAEKRRANQNKDGSSSMICKTKVRANQHTGAKNKHSSTSQDRVQKGKMKKTQNSSSIQVSLGKGNSSNPRVETPENTDTENMNLSSASDKPEQTETETIRSSAATTVKQKSKAGVNKGLAGSGKKKRRTTQKKTITLYANEEIRLKEYLEYLRSHAFPVGQTWLNIVKFAASAIVNSSNKLENRNFDLKKGPSLAWCKEFLSRRNVEGFSQKDLIYNFSSPISQVETYFTVLHSMIQELGMEECSHQIFTCGELKLGDLAKLKLTDDGQHLLADNCQSAEMTGQSTLQLAVSAMGHFLVPFLVVQNTMAKGDKFSETSSGGFMLEENDTGCMDEELFNKWFSKVFQFYSRASKNKRVILLMSNRSSLPSPEFIKAAIRRNIHIFYTPPEVSHNLLPLEHSIFNLLRHHMKHFVASSDVVDCRQLVIILKQALSKLLVSDVELAFTNTSIFEYMHSGNAEKQSISGSSSRSVFLHTLDNDRESLCPVMWKPQPKQSRASSSKNSLFSAGTSDPPSTIIARKKVTEEKCSVPTNSNQLAYSTTLPAQKSCLPSVQQQNKSTVLLVDGKYRIPLTVGPLLPNVPTGQKQVPNASVVPVGKTSVQPAKQKQLPDTSTAHATPRLSVLSDSVMHVVVPMGQKQQQHASVTSAGQGRQLAPRPAIKAKRYPDTSTAPVTPRLAVLSDSVMHVLVPIGQKELPHTPVVSAGKKSAPPAKSLLIPPAKSPSCPTRQDTATVPVTSGLLLAALSDCVRHAVVPMGQKQIPGRVGSAGKTSAPPAKSLLIPPAKGLLIPQCPTRQEPGNDRQCMPQINTEHNYNTAIIGEDSIKTEQDSSKKTEKDIQLMQESACPVALYMNSAHKK